MRIVIAGVGTALPPGGATQDGALGLLIDTAHLEGDALRFARAMFERSGIERRASVLGDDAAARAFYSSAASAPGTAARMALYARHAAPLAQHACTEALTAARCDGASITHLVTASCTGFNSPGVDIQLVERLGLRPDVHRVHVGFMGCHAAINALGVAAAIARAGGLADRRARVLVACVELSSLHLQPSDRPDHIVAAALFGDGAGACVVSAEPHDAHDAHDPHDAHAAGIEFLNAGSIIIPGSREAMGWEIGDAGFAMTLAQSVPGLVREHVRPWLEPWLERTLGPAAGPGELAWCVHPGGPKVLEAVGDAMGLDPAALCFSREVLRDHGNMSSATTLFILQRMQRAGVHSACVMLAFGPGLCMEAALVRLP